MAKQNDTSVYQLENGNWGYRFTIMRNGQRKDVRRKQDDFGNPFKTRKEATKARKLALQQEQDESRPKPKVRKTVAEVFTEYCEKGRSGKAYQTIRKQDSLWEIHLRKKFGKQFVDDISVADVEDYLSDLYYKKKYSYRYVESFLKMFYLIFGQAYSRNYMDVDIYNKLCVNKDTKIKMPKLKTDDDHLKNKRFHLRLLFFLALLFVFASLAHFIILTFVLKLMVEIIESLSASSLTLCAEACRS